MADDQLAEADQDLLEESQVHGRVPPASLKCVVNAGLLHEAAGEGGSERGQAQSLILELLHKNAASAKEQHRAELRIHAAAENELAAGPAHHRLDAHALEVAWAGRFLNRLFDLQPGEPHPLSVADVQTDASHAGLVGHGL